MKAMLTQAGAERFNVPHLANTELEITDLRTMPWGARNATVWVDGVVVARRAYVYTPGHSIDCNLLLPEDVELIVIKVKEAAPC